MGTSPSQVYPGRLVARYVLAPRPVPTRPDPVVPVTRELLAQTRAQRVLQSDRLYWDDIPDSRRPLLVRPYMLYTVTRWLARNALLDEGWKVAA